MSDGVDLSTLKGKSILVTGGASGLGLATARAFAAAGAYVTLADIQPVKEVGEKIIEELSALGYHVHYTYCDTTSWESQVQAFKSALLFAPHNTLDVVAMFAGVTSEPGNIMDHIVKFEASLDVDPVQPSIKCIEVNLIGLYYSAYLALNYFRLKPRESGQGTYVNGNATISKSLIFVDSIAGYIDFPKHTTYNASKFGVRGLFRSVRGYSRKFGVRSNLIAPWHIRTPMTAAIQEYMAKHNVPEGKGINWAKVEQVVEAVGQCVVDEGIDGELLPHTVINH